MAYGSRRGCGLNSGAAKDMKAGIKEGCAANKTLRLLALDGQSLSRRNGDSPQKDSYSVTFARRMRLLFRNTMLTHGLLSSMGSKRPSPVTPSSFLRLLTSGRQKNQDATISLQLFNAKDHNYSLAAVDYAPPIPRQAKRSSVSSWRLSSGVVSDTPLRSCTP